VDGVTKLSKLDFTSAEDRQAESYRKMLLAMVNDIRVMIVKLADRLHNMRTLGALSVERRTRIANETVEIYAPIAHRLGMGKVRGELEDLAFRYLDPEAYVEISHSIEEHREESEKFLAGIRRTIEEELRREGIPARVEGRVKRAYSVYLKLKRQKISLDQVYDLLALRIVTDSVKNCYAALGVAPGAGAHQGLHRDSPPQPVPIAAHVRGGSGRPAFRSADPHRRDAPHRRRRYCRALEI
jgi:GTP pyrophosphokinase